MMRWARENPGYAFLLCFFALLAMVDIVEALTR